MKVEYSSSLVMSPINCTQTMKSDFLHQTLTSLKQLPAESDVWESDVPAFLSSLTALSEEKAIERASVISKKTLKNAILKFQNRHSQLVEYFEFDTSEWLPPDRSDKVIIIEVTGMFERLAGLFDEYSAIPDKGSSLRQTKCLNTKRGEVETRIANIKSELDLILKAGLMSHDAVPESDPYVVSDEDLPKSEAPTVNSDATLSDLQLSEGLLEFDSSVMNYMIEFDNSVEHLVLNPIPNAVGATVAVTVGSGDNDNADVEANGGSFRVTNIMVGQTLISVGVTAEDGLSSKTYTLTMSRSASDEATLRSLGLTAGQLSFNADVVNYEIDIPSGTEDLKATFETAHQAANVVATLEHPDGDIVNASATEDGALLVPRLANGRSVLTIVVTAEDGVSTKSYEVAITSQSPSATDHVALMWSLISEDDLAGAYWISKSLANQGSTSNRLPALLKAAQAARWISPESKAFVGDIFNIVSETDTPFDDDAQVMLGLAAAIQPSLVVPETNLSAWLVTPHSLPSLKGIVGPILDFANRGYPLGPEYVRGDEWHRHLEELIADSRSRASEWLEDATKRRHNMRRANDVWKHLCTEEGILGALHKTVGGDVRSAVVKVKNDINILRQPALIDDRINEADRLIHPYVRNEIAGKARTWLNQRIAEAVDIASEWCDLVERANDAKRGPQNKWLSNHISELRNQITAASEEVFTDLRQVATDESREDLAASARCLLRSLHLLLLYLRIESMDPLPPSATQVIDDLHRVNQKAARHGSVDAADLETALSRRLLWMPETELLDDCTPSNSLQPIDLGRATSDWFSRDTSLNQVIQSRVEARDFRFLSILSLETSSDGPADPEVSFSSDLASARETLCEHWNEARTAINKAVSDGVIEFEEAPWSELTNALEDISVDQILNFKTAHDTLDSIEGTINDDRNVRRKELMTEWNSLIKELAQDPNVGSGVVEDLSKTFNLASQDASLDIRIMEDCVSRVRNHTSGDGQDLLPVQPESLSTTLEDFLTFYQNSVESPYLSGSGNRLRSLLQRPGN